MEIPPLKILLLCYEYPPIGGGGGVGAQQYAEAWASKGHSVTVLTSHASHLPRRETSCGVDIVRLKAAGRKDRATATQLSMLAYVASGALYLLRHRSTLRRFDIINTHFSLPTGPLGCLAAKLLSLPNVLTIIGGDVFDPTKRSSPHRHGFLRAVNRFLMNSADRVIAISSDTRDRAKQFYGVRRSIQVINYGFKPPERTHAPSSMPEYNGRYHLISVARLVERKGLAYLIRALAKLPGRIDLLLVGDGPLEDQLKRVAAEVGVSDRIRWLHYQSRDRIYTYLGSADCFVLASLHEGLGIVVQEAMYAGLPIVATNNGGQVDLIEPGSNGLLVNPEDSNALAEAIEKLYRDRDLAAAMARNNRRKIKSYYIDHNCEEYLRIFRQLACARWRPAFPAPRANQAARSGHRDLARRSSSKK